jgi:fluoroquinolone resistance protein
MEQLLHQDKTFEKIIYAGKEVRGREFEHCSFRFCDFSNSNFSHNRFTNCQFIGCNLALMKVNHATLDNVAFQDCKVIGLNFSECAAFLFTVRFESCLLDYASFTNRKMPKTLFRNSSLKHAVFTNANLSQSVLDNTDLQGAIFNNTNLQEANLVSAFNYTIDPELNNIKKATFSPQGIIGLLAKYDIRVG